MAGLKGAAGLRNAAGSMVVDFNGLPFIRIGLFRLRLIYQSRAKQS